MRLSELTRLGDGPVATVYSGHHDGLPVALKVFPKRFDKRTMTAFTKEQSLLSGLRRVASILPVDAVDEVDGKPALRLKLCPDSLASVVESGGPLPAADVVALGRAIALALAAAHDVGVVHGGMSPHNILFRASGEPAVSDFGLTLRQALARDPLHAIEFLPPETLRTGTLTRSTDLYGLGALLHYALVGRTPHPGRLGEQPGERVLRILGKPVPAINAPDVPVAMATLVARLLATDASHRPSDATEVATRLGGLLPNDPAEPEADFDDFAGSPPAPPAPTPPSAQPTPPPAPPPSPDPPDELDDFAAPPPAPPSRPAVPAPEPVTRDTSMWEALARREQTRLHPPPAPPPAPEPAPGPGPLEEPSRDTPAHGVLAWEAPVRDSLGWDRELQDELTGEMPPQPDDVPTQETRPREAPTEEMVPEGPFPAIPVAAPGFGPQLIAPEPAAEELTVREDQPDVVALDEPGSERREVPGPDGPFWEMPALAGSTPAPRTPAPPTGPVSVTPGVSAPVPPVAWSAPRWELDAPAGETPRDNRWRMWAGVGGGALAGALAVLLVVLLGAEPDELDTSPREPGDGGAVVGDVRLELSPPVDRKDRVELTWRSTRELDFAVVVAAEGEKTEVLLAHRKKTMTVAVEPGRKYCFMVQGTDSDRVYESQPVPLRGASCRK